ncbi:MAG: choice-of-anchor D domain-containing protein [Tepidisphaeraceae bacterium]
MLGNAVEIADGDTTPATTDATDFGSPYVADAAPTKTFTVKNTGTAALTTSALTVPAGFTVTEGLNASIAAGGSDTFTVKLNTTTAGTFAGNVSFANNDSNENPYNFAIKGVVNPQWYSLVSNVLTITGTANADLIRGSIASNVLTMKLNSYVKTFANASAITRVVVNAGAGNDTVIFGASMNRPTSINGGDGNDTLVGGSGVDAINGGAGTDIATRGASDTVSLAEEIIE